MFMEMITTAGQINKGHRTKKIKKKNLFLTRTTSKRRIRSVETDAGKAKTVDD